MPTGSQGALLLEAGEAGPHLQHLEQRRAHAARDADHVAVAGAHVLPRTRRPLSTRKALTARHAMLRRRRHAQRAGGGCEQHTVRHMQTAAQSRTCSQGRPSTRTAVTSARSRRGQTCGSRRSMPKGVRWNWLKYTCAPRTRAYQHAALSQHRGQGRPAGQEAALCQSYFNFTPAIRCTQTRRGSSAAPPPATPNCRGRRTSAKRSSSSCAASLSSCTCTTSACPAAPHFFSPLKTCGAMH